MKYVVIAALFPMLMFSKSHVNYDDLLYYTAKKFRAPESVNRICTWQYAIIKLQTNKSNQVVSYSILNNVSTDLTNSLKYLIGYQFKKICLFMNVL
jgi:hypothetical protein